MSLLSKLKRSVFIFYSSESKYAARKKKRRKRSLRRVKRRLCVIQFMYKALQ